MVDPRQIELPFGRKKEGETGRHAQRSGAGEPPENNGQRKREVRVKRQVGGPSLHHIYLLMEEMLMHLYEIDAHSYEFKDQGRLDDLYNEIRPHVKNKELRDGPR